MAWVYMFPLRYSLLVAKGYIRLYKYLHFFSFSVVEHITLFFVIVSVKLVILLALLNTTYFISFNL